MGAMKTIAIMIEEWEDKDLIEETKNEDETFDFLDGLTGVDSFYKGIRLGKAEIVQELKEMFQ